MNVEQAELCAPPQKKISYIAVLTPCTLDWLYLGDRAFKEVNKVKWGHMVEP